MTTRHQSVPQLSPDLIEAIQRIRKALRTDFTGMYREAGGIFPHPFLTPGSKDYADILWDWDSWLSNVALRQILSESADPLSHQRADPYEKGSILNYLSFANFFGWIPIQVPRETKSIKDLEPENFFDANMHKPCLAQHAAFLIRENGGEAEWIHESFEILQRFINNYRNHHFHSPTGLYYWQNDNAIGVDDDPSTYYRPPKSSGSIFLNCLMLRELEAMAYISERLGLQETIRHFRGDAVALKEAIRKHCWDEWTGFYYSVDLNLLPKEHLLRGEKPSTLHAGQYRDWECLLMRFGVWSGFLAMWAGVASEDEAKRMVEEHFKNANTFRSPWGVRSLSRLEKMYNVRASGNPSTWRGPLWGIVQYLVFQGLRRYGYDQEARELAVDTIRLFGRDLGRFGALHEYYEPETGEPILNRGFQNWNYLVLGMIQWIEGKDFIKEF